MLTFWTSITVRKKWPRMSSEITWWNIYCVKAWSATKSLFPPVLSKKIGRNHTAEHNAQRLNERHFITNIPGGEGRKRKRPTRSCFVCSKLPGLNCKPKRTSFWCEDCGKPLCITPCFKIYHTEIDFKLHALNFRQEGTGTVVVQGVEVNDCDDNLWYVFVIYFVLLIVDWIINYNLYM